MKKIIIVFSIIGFIGLVLSLTSLNNVLVPFPAKRGYVDIPLPLGILAIGFGVAGAFIQISLRKK